MNRVDPNLFVTCRLCLEELGLYQIIPSIQEQIMSCYDIVIDAFDGLPQLVCQQCETNLRNHYEIKQKYLEKQKSLKERVNLQNARNEQESQLPLSQLHIENEKPERTKKRKFSSTTESTVSTYAEDSCSTPSWESNYYKRYYCRLCKYKAKDQKFMGYHIRMHKSMKNSYSNILNQYCYVKLEKIDGKPNKTHCNDTVMLNSKKIIVSYCDYIIQYTPRRNCSIESSDTESTVIKIPNKRKRILSTSSSDTVVIDKRETINAMIKQEKVHDTNDCIQISSDESDHPDDQEVPKLKTEEPIKACGNDYKTIDNISSNCYTKYLKRVENMKKTKLTELSSSMESQLNHKVLNIGRKILSGNPLNCMGLLRFLEHKNLPVVWSPANNTSRDTNIVIRTLSKNLSLQSTCDDSNWSYQKKRRSDVPPKPAIDTMDTSSPRTESIYQDLRSLLTSNSRMPVQVKTVTLNNTETKGKILNASPVANPKPAKVRSDIRADISVDNEENSFSLPIITSTTSLVPHFVENGSEDTSQEASKETTSYPLIKVKPVSELMSAEALNNLAKQAPFSYSRVPRSASVVVPLNGNFPTYGISEGLPHSTYITSQTVENGLPQFTSVISNHPCENVNEKCIILDTVQLPNTKTNSPFKYLKNLLQISNLILLDKDEDTTKYCCLIKFKVSFKQDTTEPVIFGMQLFYYNRSFCIKVKDKNQSNIPITTLSADWQWEMIKTLKGDVMKKILANAEKVSKEAYSDVQNFRCLLDSIQYKKAE